MTPEQRQSIIDHKRRMAERREADGSIIKREIPPYPEMSAAAWREAEAKSAAWRESNPAPTHVYWKPEEPPAPPRPDPATPSAYEPGWVAYTPDATSDAQKNILLIIFLVPWILGLLWFLLSFMGYH